MPISTPSSGQMDSSHSETGKPLNIQFKEVTTMASGFMDKSAIIKEKMDELWAWIEGADEEVWGDDE